MLHRHRTRIVSLIAAASTVILSGCSPTPTPATTAAPAGTATAPNPRSTSATIKDADGKTMAELFHNKFAGVQVFQVPGGGIQVRIRNAGGLNDRGDPLYVVNGVPMNTPDGTLFIEPNEISKIEVLKDDASTSIYGMRGANGVVKITTKK